MNISLRQGCVVSLWFFNIFMNGVVSKVTAKIREHRTRMVYGGEKRWEVSQLLFADEISSCCR